MPICGLTILASTLLTGLGAPGCVLDDPEIAKEAQKFQLVEAATPDSSYKFLWTEKLAFKPLPRGFIVVGEQPLEGGWYGSPPTEFTITRALQLPFSGGLFIGKLAGVNFASKESTEGLSSFIEETMAKAYQPHQKLLLGMKTVYSQKVVKDDSPWGAYDGSYVTVRMGYVNEKVLFQGNTRDQNMPIAFVTIGRSGFYYQWVVEYSEVWVPKNGWELHSTKRDSLVQEIVFRAIGSIRKKA